MLSTPSLKMRELEIIDSHPLLREGKRTAQDTKQEEIQEPFRGCISPVVDVFPIEC